VILKSRPKETEEWLHMRLRAVWVAGWQRAAATDGRVCLDCYREGHSTAQHSTAWHTQLKTRKDM